MVVIWAFVIRCLFCEETQLLMVWNKFWSSILIFENLYSYFRFHELLRNIETIPLYENWRHILTDAMRIMHNENATSEKISTNPIYPTLLFSSYIFMNISELSPHCNNFNFFKELCRPEKNRDSWNIPYGYFERKYIHSEFYLYRTFKINFF